MRVMQAIFAAFVISVSSAYAQGPLRTHQAFTAPPDATAEEVLIQCIAFAEEASADGSEHYVTAHTDYRWCLFDLREREEGLSSDRVGEALSRVLQDADPVVKMHTHLALGRIGYTPAAPLVAEGLNSTDWRVVLSAARALGAIGSTEQLPALLAASGHPSSQADDEIFSAYLALGGPMPMDDAQGDWLESLDRAERLEWLREVELFRDELRAQYQGEGSPTQGGDPWAGDRNTFGQALGVYMDENFEMVDACPEQLFVDQAGRQIDLTRGPLQDGIQGPESAFEIEGPDGGQLVGSLDTNPQYLGGGPGALSWEGAGGNREVLLEQPILFRFQAGPELILIAGPGEGPSNGALYRVDWDRPAAPALRKLYELPGIAWMVRRYDEERLAIMTRDQTAFALDASGNMEPLACVHWKTNSAP